MNRFYLNELYVKLLNHFEWQYEEKMIKYEIAQYRNDWKHRYFTLTDNEWSKGEVTLWISIYEKENINKSVLDEFANKIQNLLRQLLSEMSIHYWNYELCWEYKYDNHIGDYNWEFKFVILFDKNIEVVGNDYDFNRRW